MEFEGIVHKKLEPVSGTNARGNWTKQEIIFELPGEFARKVCVSFWGDKADDAAGLNPGDKVMVSVNIESREYNGRWYTEVRAWKISALSSDRIHARQEMPPLEAIPEETANDLPF